MLRRVLALAALVASGVLVAVVGAVVHRATPYVGAALVIALTLFAAIFARTWQRFAGLAAYAAAWVAVAVTLVYVKGPGGSFFYVDDALGRTWLLGSAAAFVVVSLVPRSLLEGSGGVPTQA